MIRYVYISNQISIDPDINQFCFYNTVNDEFIKIDDEYLFDSIEHLKECCKNDVDNYPIERLLRLIKNGVNK